MAPAESVSASVDTLASGTVVVQYERLPDSAAVVQADLRIGALEGDAATTFGDVRGVEAAADGTIYVLDYQAAEVRAFDSTGSFQGVVARQGEGPGEISEANGIQLVGDSLLWIQDHRKWMMLAITREGDERLRVPMHVRRYGYIWSGTVDRNGVHWKSTAHTDNPSTIPEGEELREYSMRQYVKWHDPATSEMDSVFLGEYEGRTYIAPNNRGGYTYRPIPFAPAAQHVVSLNGDVWVSDESEYSIVRLDADGDTALVLRVSVPPPEVSDEEVEEYVDGQLQRAPDQRQVIEKIVQLIGDSKPAIDQLITDDLDRLWVRQSGGGDPGPRYDIFERDGTHVGSVRFTFAAAPYFPPTVQDGHVYTIVTDELDVPTVVRGGLPKWSVR